MPIAADAIAALAYGDGLFETMRAHRGDVPWWDAHWQRLQRGARRLRHGAARPRRRPREATRLLAGADAVLKLIVTRGAGGRGYAPASTAMPTWILVAAPAAAGSTGRRDCSCAGATRAWRCSRRWRASSTATGWSRCWRAPNGDRCAGDAIEGLMCSTEGDVVSATAANVFVLRDGALAHPAGRSLRRCRRLPGLGAGGSWQRGEARLAVTEVEAADAVFLCNAVRGILPVARLGARTWSTASAGGRAAAPAGRRASRFRRTNDAEST